MKKLDERKKSKQIFNIRVASVLIVQVISHKLLAALKTELSTPPGKRAGSSGRGRSGAAGFPIDFQDGTRALQGSTDTRPLITHTPWVCVPGWPLCLKREHGFVGTSQ